jgi:hypothetical protein
MSNEVTNKSPFPTEIVELPSKGLVYPSTNPLSSGKIEMKYMTAAHEDILTNQSYIQNGTVLDKLIESLIVSKINYGDIIVGDKNALLIAARVLGYGKDYEFTYKGENVTVDLSTLEPKPIDESLFTPGKNEFEYELPASGTKITFKLLTHSDENKINQELQGLKKINKNASPESSTRFKYMITSVNGDSTTKTIREFVDNYFLAKDTRSLREYIKLIQPDIDMKFDFEGPNGLEEGLTIPMGISFFWPDARI